MTHKVCAGCNKLLPIEQFSPKGPVYYQSKCKACRREAVRVKPEDKKRTGPQRKSLADRFWFRLDRSDPDACWPWPGATNGKYGIISRGGYNGPPLFAHRVAYALANRIDPITLATDFVIRHSCNNPLCCNPKHLSSGTTQDNIDDMIAAGRGWWQRK